MRPPSTRCRRATRQGQRRCRRGHDFLQMSSEDAYTALDGVAGGLLGCWVAGLLGCWVAGLLGCWVAGLLGCWVAGLLGCWVAGLLGCWVAGDVTLNPVTQQ